MNDRSLWINWHLVRDLRRRHFIARQVDRVRGLVSSVAADINQRNPYLRSLHAYNRALSSLNGDYQWRTQGAQVGIRNSRRDRVFALVTRAVQRCDLASALLGKWERDTRTLWQQFEDLRERGRALVGVSLATFESDALRCERALRAREQCDSYRYAQAIDGMARAALARMTDLLESNEEVGVSIGVLEASLQQLDRGDLGADREAERHYTLLGRNVGEARSAFNAGDLHRAQGCLAQATLALTYVEHYLAIAKNYMVKDCLLWSQTAERVPSLRLVGSWGALESTTFSSSLVAHRSVMEELSDHAKSLAVQRRINSADLFGRRIIRLRLPDTGGKLRRYVRDVQLLVRDWQ